MTNALIIQPNEQDEIAACSCCSGNPGVSGFVYDGETPLAVYFAEPTVRTIYDRIRLLKASPNRGRPGHRSGTKELALTPLPYVVVYSVKADAVEILHIYHGAQDWR